MSSIQKIKGNIVDILQESIYPATLEIENGRISSIKREQKPADLFIIPGFVDAHIHIESSLLPPSEFARLAVIHGTVATVSDPHEIGNVCGLEGVNYMLKNASTVPFKFYFGAPSCVPATIFETAGALLGPDEIDLLLSKKEIKYLSEVMNFPGVIQREPGITAKIAIAKKRGKRIDGHAPGVTGEALKKYISAGIETDHECTRLEEAQEKLSLGMKILIREGSAARNFDALIPLLHTHADHCMFCSDDKHPDSLEHGHINLLVKRALEKGFDLMKVLRCASWNPISHYELEVGLLRQGDPADFLCVNNLEDLRVLSTTISGELVAQNQKVLFPRITPPVINHFHTHLKKPEDFHLDAQPGRLKVIEALDGQLITKQLEVDPLVENNFVVSNVKEGILKIAVINRYQNVSPQIAFVKNFGLKQGAIASSVAHDSHNIIAVGVSDEALCKAVNCLITHRGGLCVVDGDKEECLPLPIAGLMSALTAEEVCRRYKELDNHAKKLGSFLEAPFMTLSFMALLVIPALKLSDKGLFDEKTFNFTDLFTSNTAKRL